MKKTLYSLLAITLTAFTLTSCEDVPAPYDDPNDNPIDEPEVIEPAGDGTLANPFNVAATIAEAEKLASGEETTEEIYIKGVVTNITENYDRGYGNATYYISDDEDGTNQFYIYRSKYFDNTNYSSGPMIEYGDTVVVCGRITNYNGTLETVQNGSYLYSINGETNTPGGGDEPSTGGQPEGDGTLENPFNCVAANQFASSLAADEVSENDVYIKGIVVSIREQFGTQYGNATYYISDDGTADNQFYVFRSLYLNNEKYTSGDLLSVGDEVVVCGKVTNYYGNTPETVEGESYLYSWTKNSNPGGGDEPGGGDTGNSITVDVNSFGLDNQTVLSTLTLDDGTTLSFDAGDNRNGPTYYTTGTGSIRMYPNNTMTVSSDKTIESIVLNFDNYNGTIYNASGDIACSAGSISVSGETATISGVGGNGVTITNTSGTTGAASQIRMTSFTITYAE